MTSTPDIYFQLSLDENPVFTLEQYELKLGICKDILAKFGLNIQSSCVRGFGPLTSNNYMMVFSGLEYGSSDCREKLFHALNKIFKDFGSDEVCMYGWFFDGGQYYKISMSYQDEDNYYPYVDPADEEEAKDTCILEHKFFNR